jgi:outer membrane protein, heavy metal efflux system
VQPIARLLLVLIVTLLARPVFAEPPRVVVGETGLTLGHSVAQQDKSYITERQALGSRIACLLQDVDTLLAGLHALPPEWQGSEIQAKPVAAELQGLIDLALRYSPELKPMQSELAVLAAKTRQAGARMDPMLSFMWMDIPAPEWPPASTWDDAMMSRLSFSYSQTFDSYGKRDLKRGIAHLDEKVKELRLAEMERKVIGEVTDTYFMLLDTQARLRVMDANIKLMQLLLDLAQQKYSLGLTPQAAVLSSQVALTKMERERLDMQQMLASQQAMLSGMLGYPDGFDPAALKLELGYPLPQPIALDATALRAAALDRLPDYQSVKLQQTQQGLMLEMARREYRPDYTVTAGYDVRWKQRDMISAGVMVPLSLNKAERQDAQVQEAAAMQAMLGDELRQQDNALQSAIQAQLIELTRRRELIDLSRNGLVPQARLALDSNIAGFAANMMDLSDLVMSQQTLLDAELELEQNYIAYVAGLARLQVLTGGAFDPAPFLAPSLGAQDTAAAVSVPTLDQAEGPRAQLPFVDALSLPENPAAEPVAPDAGQTATPPDESTLHVEDTEQQTGGEQEAPPKPGGDGFYQPYQPKKGQE